MNNIPSHQYDTLLKIGMKASLYLISLNNSASLLVIQKLEFS